MHFRMADSKRISESKGSVHFYEVKFINRDRDSMRCLSRGKRDACERYVCNDYVSRLKRKAERRAQRKGALYNVAFQRHAVNAINAINAGGT